jgi:tetratricopeptide (TPR) repeat protein
MKKTHLYFITLGLLIIAAGFIVVKYKKEEKNKAAAFYLLKDRTGVLAQSNEWKQVQKRFADLMKAVRTNPDEMKSRIALAGLYIQEARVTGNYPYYDMAAMKYLNEVLEKDSLNFEALSLKSLCYLSQHHFADGLALAEKALAVNPYNAFVHGILVDGQVKWVIMLKLWKTLIKWCLSDPISALIQEYLIYGRSMVIIPGPSKR